MGDRYRRLLRGYVAPRSKVTPVRNHILEADRAEALLEVVRRLLENPEDASFPEERRQSFRRPYPRAVLMTPCDFRGDPRVADAVTVVVKDLSPGSVGFVHNRALREKTVLLAMQVSSGPPLCLLTAIRRVQAVRQGLYLVGGEFVGRVETKEEDGGNSGTNAGPTRSR